jgi:hypothetical protein
VALLVELLTAAMGAASKARALRNFNFILIVEDEYVFCDWEVRRQELRWE